jgi:hypothetical protein
MAFGQSDGMGFEIVRFGIELFAFSLSVSASCVLVGVWIFSALGRGGGWLRGGRWAGSREDGRGTLTVRLTLMLVIVIQEGGRCCCDRRRGGKEGRRCVIDS